VARPAEEISARRSFGDDCNAESHARDYRAHESGCHWSEGRSKQRPYSKERRERQVALSAVVRSFKSISAIRVNQILGRQGVPVWQRNYYDHIIRNAREFGDIQEYIVRNPERWDWDPENI
jgi:hypothetical protein